MLLIGRFSGIANTFHQSVIVRIVDVMFLRLELSDGTSVLHHN